MSEPCEFGCTVRGKHLPPCGCTLECDDTHTGHCKGCEPRTADDETGHWCKWHYDRIRADLHRLADLVTLLDVADDGKITARSRDGGDLTRRATKVGQLSPSPAADLADESARWASSWAETVADYLGHHGPFAYTTAGVLAPQLHRHANYLAANLPTIAEAPFSKDFGGEARTMTRTVELATGQDQLTHRIKADRCLACQQRTLTRADGSDRVICANQDCQRVWLESEYVTLVRWTTNTEAAAS